MKSWPRVWQMPQLLSLDTAAVAVVWQMLVAREFHVPLRGATVFITPAAVWMIYVADHLLDTRGNAPLSFRHVFVRQHRNAFLAAFAVLLVSCTVSLIWVPAATLLSGLSLSLAVLVYAAVVHFASGNLKKRWPKEVVVGLVFACGSTIATWSHPPVAKSKFIPLLLFIGLCILNCAMLEFQEWQKRPAHNFPPHSSTQRIAQHDVLLTVCLLAATASASWAIHQTRIGVAIATSAALQLLIVRLTKHRSADAVLALADISLLTPLLMLWR